jgi:quercetin dioxygenase-like cupin family protein
MQTHEAPAGTAGDEHGTQFVSESQRSQDLAIALAALQLALGGLNQVHHRRVVSQHHRRQHMYTTNLNTLDLFDAWYENDPHMRTKVNFPFSKATGNASSAVVYFEIEPGHYLATHTDSAEEIVLLLSGTVEASVGDEGGTLTAGSAVLIPAMIPHGIRNVGTEKARCVGFFASATLVSTFDQTMMPFGVRVIATPPPVDAA